jgi:hypothetical protein
MNLEEGIKNPNQTYQNHQTRSEKNHYKLKRVIECIASDQGLDAKYQKDTRTDSDKNNLYPPEEYTHDFSISRSPSAVKNLWTE